MKTQILLSTLLCLSTMSYSQNDSTSQAKPDSLPYYQIPDYPPEYTAETAVARMIDGLGFRYYWATESLRPEDLAFRPNAEARTSEETIDHILSLSAVVANAVRQLPNTRGSEGDADPSTFAEKRKQTLENLKEASDLLKSGQIKLEDCPVVFENGTRRSEFPFWNNINGPIADALWHTGQVVSFRRSSGNPFNPKVSVFMGTVRE